MRTLQHDALLPAGRLLTRMMALRASEPRGAVHSMFTLAISAASIHVPAAAHRIALSMTGHNPIATGSRRLVVLPYNYYIIAKGCPARLTADLV